MKTSAAEQDPVNQWSHNVLSDEKASQKPKGVSHLIEIENPNRAWGMNNLEDLPVSRKER